MRELFNMWNNTKMIVLVALSAALYAAILIPFKVVLPFIPGFTELRPASVIPILTSLFFGPAAVWGAGFGNLIGDILGGTFGIASSFGFIGNLLYALIPYRIFRAFSITEPSMKRSKPLLLFILSVFLASAACGGFIGWGVEILGLIPFAALSSIIFLNNFIVSLILGPLLLPILYPRIRAWNLFYANIIEEVKPKRLWVLWFIIFVIGTLGLFLLGNLISLGLYKSALLGAGFTRGSVGGLSFGLWLLPFVILMLLGIAFL